MSLNYNNILILFLSSIIIFFGLSVSASAAVLSLNPSSISTAIGDEFSISVSIDTEDTAINAADVRLEFPKDILEVIDIDRTGSIFAFWVDDPFFSNESGTVEFIGGSAKGLSGDSLHVLSVSFKTNNTGTGSIVPINAIVTASDGKGTNVLYESFGVSVTSGSEVFVPEPVFKPEEIVVEAPKEVVREAVKGIDLPEAPQVRVPLYPDESKWYSHKNAITALWDIPDDITKVAVEVDRIPNTEPSKSEETLVNGKQLGIFEEGISFIHVQFKNNIGWGDVRHYSVSIDAEPPLPFEIVTSAYISDNPTPVITFETQDALSGISHSLITLDGGEITRTASTTATLGPLVPGPHSIKVQTFDYAGNSVEDVVEIEILPLPKPVVSFVSRSVSLGESVFISGSAIPNGFVDIKVLDKNGQELITQSTETSTSGSWEASITETLKTGKYEIIVSARDMRGAISYDTEPRTTNIRSKVIFSLGIIEFGWFEIFLSLVVTVLVSLGVGVWMYLSELGLRNAYIVIVVRDIKKFSAMFDSHISALEKQVRSKKNKIDKQSKGEINYELEQLRETTKKMTKYLTEQTKKIG